MVKPNPVKLKIVSMLPVLSYNTYLSLMLEQLSVKSEIPDPDPTYTNDRLISLVIKVKPKL